MTSDQAAPPADDRDLRPWRLAWRRTKRDHGPRTFVARPFVDWLVDRNVDEYLTLLKSRAEKAWAPNAAATCYQPKGHGLVRPGGVLRVDDEVYYNLLLGSMHNAIRQGLAWSQGDPDLAYPLSDSPDDDECIVHWSKPWSRWRDLSNERLGQSAYVVFADISAYYENVDLHRLASDLRDLGCDAGAVNELTRCLNRWAMPRGRGIPQGYSASDILAKVYLSTVDGRLRGARLIHLRYVDDIRIFCQEHGEALQALHCLTECLRGHGLNIQSAKTRILAADTPEARAQINGVAPIIDDVQDALLDEIAGALYVSLAEIAEIAEATPDAPCVAVLERAWEDNITPQTVASVDKTLLRYLLNRLTAARSALPFELLPPIIRKRPEELECCLGYLARCARQSETVTQLPQLIRHGKYVYDHSIFLTLRWMWSYWICSPRLLDFARAVATDRNRSSWTRAHALAILGRWGNRADLDLLLDLYPDTADEIERSEIVCCTARLEHSRRNAFLGRVAGECMWTRWAAEAVRCGALCSLMAPEPVQEPAS